MKVYGVCKQKDRKNSLQFFKIRLYRTTETIFEDQIGIILRIKLAMFSKSIKLKSVHEKIILIRLESTLRRDNRTDHFRLLLLDSKLLLYIPLYNSIPYFQIGAITV